MDDEWIRRIVTSEAWRRGVEQAEAAMQTGRDDRGIEGETEPADSERTQGEDTVRQVEDGGPRDRPGDRGDGSATAHERWSDSGPADVGRETEAEEETQITTLF